MTSTFEWREAPASDYAVLGDPVGHSLSPRMFSAAFAETGLPYQYVATRVPLEEFEAAMNRLAGLGYLGVNVTVPLKEAAFRWCARHEGLAERIGAANTIRLAERAGTNTDAPGLLDVLVEQAIPEGPILVLGAGGSARAALAALSDAGRELALWNRTRTRAEELLEELSVSAKVLDTIAAGGFAAILNTTSASLSGQELSVDWTGALPGALAFDLAYGPQPTPFVRDAEAHGVRAIDGRPLLVAQGARAFEWWFGIEAPRSAMLQAVA